MNSSSNNIETEEGSAAENASNHHHSPTTIADAYSSHPELDIRVDTVTCRFKTGCLLHLKNIGRRVPDTTYIAAKLAVRMNILKPFSVAMIKASGSVTVFGCGSPFSAFLAGQQVARALKRIVPGVRMRRFKEVSVLSRCRLPFGVDVEALCDRHPRCTELAKDANSGDKCVYYVYEPTALVSIYNDGRVTIETRKIAHVAPAMDAIFPCCHRYSRPDSRRSVADTGTGPLLGGMSVLPVRIM